MSFLLCPRLGKLDRHICWQAIHCIHMGKKRKHGETKAVTDAEDETAPERPKRTLLGFKTIAEDKKEIDGPLVGFRNKEKVLVTCSRRISFRLVFNTCTVGHKILS